MTMVAALAIGGEQATSASAVRAGALGSVSYVVNPGDTLASIAARYGTTVSAIASANEIRDPNLVVIGRRLTIPAGAVSATTRSGLPSRLLAHPDRLVLRSSFQRWAARYRVPADLLQALAWVESGWQARVISRTGAIGIGQLMPATVVYLRLLIGVRLDPFNADDNVRMTARFLRLLLDNTRGSVTMTLAAYYQGLRSVQTRPVYAETMRYVATVLAFRPAFR
jgi:soluble lytic murein transglycosylase-like protein